MAIVLRCYEIIYWRNLEDIPEGSVIFQNITEARIEVKEHTVRDLNDFEKFVIVGMAMYIGMPIIF